MSEKSIGSSNTTNVVEHSLAPQDVREKTRPMQANQAPTRVPSQHATGSARCEPSLPHVNAMDYGASNQATTMLIKCGQPKSLNITLVGLDLTATADPIVVSSAQN